MHAAMMLRDITRRPPAWKDKPAQNLDSRDIVALLTLEKIDARTKAFCFRFCLVGDKEEAAQIAVMYMQDNVQSRGT
jgi:hypothetical protein